MTISDPVNAAPGEPTATLDQEARLPPASAVAVILVLSSLAWAVVVLIATALRIAL